MNDLSVSLRELCKEVDTGYNDLLATSDFVGSLYNTRYSLENLCNIVNKSDYISPTAIRLMKVNLNSVNRRNGLAEVHDSVYSLESYNDIPQHLLKRKLVVSIEEGFFDKITQTITSIWRKVNDFFNTAFNKVFNIKDQLAENATELMKRIKKLHLDAVPYPIDENIKGLNIQQFRDMMVNNFFSSLNPKESDIYKKNDEFLSELEVIRKYANDKKGDIQKLKDLIGNNDAKSYEEDTSPITDEDRGLLKEINKEFDEHVSAAMEKLKDLIIKHLETIEDSARNINMAAKGETVSGDNKDKANENVLIHTQEIVDATADILHSDNESRTLDNLRKLGEHVVKCSTFNPRIKGNTWDDLYQLAYAVKDIKVEKGPEEIGTEIRKVIESTLELPLDGNKAKRLLDIWVSINNFFADYNKNMVKAGTGILGTIESFVKEAESKSGNDKKENK